MRRESPLIVSSHQHRRSDIQGLRGLAILLVVVFHAWQNVLPGGYIGVDVFFVISGYLITGLLLREIDASGRIDFAAFYARRIRRLLPAAALVTVAAVGLQLLRAPWDMRDFSTTAVAAALYVSNMWFAALSVDYLQEGVHRNMLLHTWSLAVEEQFYLVWPALVAAAAAWSRRTGSLAAVVWMTAGLSMLSFAACLWLSAAQPSWAFFSLPTRAWEFGFGAGACLLERRAWQPAEALRRMLAPAGLLCILAAATLYSAGTAFPGHAALLPAAGALLVVLGGMGGRADGSFSVLGLPALQRLGDWSYAWYLWHWPVLIYFADAWPALPRWQTALAGVLVSLGLASASHALVESPVRYGALSRARPSRTLVFGLLLTLLVVGLAAGSRFVTARDKNPEERRRIERAARDHPRIYDDNCLARATDTAPPVCFYGRVDSRHTIALMGDSHAAQWFPAVEKLALAHGARLAVFVKAACPVATVEPFDARLRRPYVECTTWREEVLQRLAQLRPKLVIAGNSSFYEAFVGGGDPQAPAQWRAGWQTTLDRVAAIGSPVVMLRDTPRPPSHVPRCLGEAWLRQDKSPAACSFGLSSSLLTNAFELERSAAQGREGVWLVDMTDTICPGPVCAVQRDGVILYHDAQHLSARFASSLADALWRRMPTAAQSALRGQ
jgi:peptidoglycan/LPS O-acetylase OafA/YrhL